MSALQKIFPNMYRDSVALMRLSAEASDLPGIEAVSAIMATEANIALLAEAGLRVVTNAPAYLSKMIVADKPI